MASLDEAFITQINTSASARNPNAYLGMWQQQPQPGWGQQHQEWLTPKYTQQPQINDSVSPQQAAAQIAHQHRFTANELRLTKDNPADTHWWFIRPRTGIEYCYPKRYNYTPQD